MLTRIKKYIIIAEENISQKIRLKKKRGNKKLFNWRNKSKQINE